MRTRPVHPSRRALLALFGWTALGLGAAVAPGLAPLAWGALAALTGLLAWDGLLLRRTPAATASRRLPARAALGRALEIELVISNPGERAVRVEVIEELPRDLAPEEPHLGPIRIEAGELATLGVRLCPRRRGDRPLGRALLLEHSPLGLLVRRGRSSAGDLLPVYPDTSRLLGAETLDPKRLLAALGVKPAPQRGQGMEFEMLREYVPGDDPRRIDWRATARRGRVITRVHRHERNHTVVIALDASRLMAARSGEHTKLDRAVDAALALALTALAHGDRVGVVVFDRQVRGHVTPRSRRAEFGPLVELLRHVQPRLVEADYASLVRSLAARQRQRALVVLLSDFVEPDDARFTAPLVVLARRHRTLFAALRDPVYQLLDPRADPRDAHDLYRRLVVDDLLHEREAALAGLRRAGVQTLDLPPSEIVAPVLNRYLAFRFGPER